MVKKNFNFWLTDEEFLRKSSISDTYYLEGLCYKISSFLKNVPVHIVTRLNNDSISFFIGSNEKEFKIDYDLSYYDYITRIRMWSRQFFPQYKCEIKKEVELSDEEMKEKVKEGMDLNDVLLLTKEITEVKEGRIEKVYLKDDCFLFNDFAGNLEKRTTVYAQKCSPVSSFIEKFRACENDEQKYNYLMENSKSLGNVEETEINVEYSGKQMINFFKINYEDLKNIELIQISEFIFKWGRFKIQFNSLTLRDDCIKIHNKLKEVKNV